jgi:hypothetical protein
MDDKELSAIEEEFAESRRREQAVRLANRWGIGTGALRRPITLWRCAPGATVMASVWRRDSAALRSEAHRRFQGRKRQFAGVKSRTAISIAVQ